MLYLLDANVLITAHNTYYALDVVPEFWEWILYQAANGAIKIPVEIYEEIEDGGSEKKDLLFTWISNKDNKSTLLLDEEVDESRVATCTSKGYAPDLTDQDLLEIGRDPFLIAYAMASPKDRCVVTKEVSAPGKQRQNRRVPDVCITMGVDCCNTVQMIKALGFKTGWKKAS